MTTNKTIDGVPIHQWSDDDGISWCDGNERSLQSAREAGWKTRTLYAEQPAPVAVITYQQVFKAYEYAESHPHKYLRGTTNWCAAVAHSLNIK